MSFGEQLAFGSGFLCRLWRLQEQSGRHPWHHSENAMAPECQSAGFFCGRGRRDSYLSPPFPGSSWRRILAICGESKGFIASTHPRTLLVWFNGERSFYPWSSRLESAFRLRGMGLVGKTSYTIPAGCHRGAIDGGFFWSECHQGEGCALKSGVLGLEHGLQNTPFDKNVETVVPWPKVGFPDSVVEGSIFFPN